MKDQETINNFILMREQGLRYKEIGEELNVSRPTLIKWNKQFAETIEKIKKKIIADFVERLYEENKETILNQVETLYRVSQPDVENDKLAGKHKDRAIQKLDKIFNIKIYAISLSFYKNFDLEKITLKCGNEKDNS